MREGFSSIFDHIEKSSDIDVNASFDVEAPQTMMFTPDELNMSASLESMVEAESNEEMSKQAFTPYSSGGKNLDEFETPEIWTVKKGNIIRNKDFEEQ